VEPIDRRLVAAVTGVVVVFLVAVVGSFLVPVGEAAPEPVTDGEVIQRGYTGATQQAAAERGETLPRVQVFYSQYEYVLGYVGVSQAVAALDAPDRRDRFGYPLAVYVSDYAGAAPACRDGSLVTETTPAWIAAGDAVYVVDSGAQTPTGESLIVPFGNQGAAAAFADDCGGRVVGWETLDEREFAAATVAVSESAVTDRHRRADQRVTAARAHLDREVSVVVGRDAATLAEAVTDAPPNTTVVVPPGRYRGGVNVTKPLTIRASSSDTAGAHDGDTVSPPDPTVGGDAQSAPVVIDGGGNGSVLRVDAPNVTVAGVRLTGVGNETVPPRDELADANGSWDARVLAAYGSGDAGVTATPNASGLYVRNVSVVTNASGLLVRGGDAVVDGVRVQGADGWQDGFMGVAALRSTVVVQQSLFRDGRDGVYLHRADGSVVQNNRFERGRFGTHLMYSSDTLVADNVAREQDLAGVVVMTSPSGNAIVGNDVRRSRAGVLTAGSRTYVARNVIVDTDDGLSTAATQSVYEHNVLVDNEVGVSATSLVPSSTVAANDFAGNDRHASASSSVLRVFDGNYWQGATGKERPDGTRSRPYAPTAPLDRQLHHTDAAATLRASPVVTALRGFRGSAPGLRSAGVIDTAPLAEPANPTRLARARNGTTAAGPAWFDTEAAR